MSNIDFITYDRLSQKLSFLPNERVAEIATKDNAFIITYKDGTQDIVNLDTIIGVAEKPNSSPLRRYFYHIARIVIADYASYKVNIAHAIFDRHNITLHNLSDPKLKSEIYYSIGLQTNAFIETSEQFTYVPILKYLAPGATITYTSKKARSVLSSIGYQPPDFAGFLPTCVTMFTNKLPNFHKGIKTTLERYNFGEYNKVRIVGIDEALTANNFSTLLQTLQEAYEKNNNTPLSQKQTAEYLRNYSFISIPFVSINLANNHTVKITREAPENLSLDNLDAYKHHTFYPFINSILQSYNDLEQTSTRKNQFRDYRMFLAYGSFFFAHEYIFKSALLLHLGNKEYNTTNNNLPLNALNLGLYYIAQEYLIGKDWLGADKTDLPSFQLEVTLPLLDDGTCPITVEAPDNLPKEQFMVAQNKLIINPDAIFFVIEKTITNDSDLETFTSAHKAYTFTRKGNTLRGTYYNTDAILSAITLKIKQPLTPELETLAITTTLRIPNHPVQTKQHLLGEVFKR